jgi:4-azaleucine resistance transporter AzlC
VDANDDREPSTPGRTRAAEGFTDGLRVGLGPGAAAFVLALAYGSAAASSGWGVAAPVAFSVFAFSGSAQFTALAALSTGTVLTAVTAAVLVNLRYVIMSVALNDSLRGNRFRRILQAQALADASFVVAHRGHGEFDVPRLLGATVPQWVCWVGGTAIGALLAPPPDLAQTLGLDVVFPAFFLVLVLEELRGSPRARLAAALGAGVAGALLLVTDTGSAVLGASLAMLVGVVPDERSTSQGRELT